MYAPPALYTKNVCRSEHGDAHQFWQLDRSSVLQWTHVMTVCRRNHTKNGREQSSKHHSLHLPPQEKFCIPCRAMRMRRALYFLAHASCGSRGLSKVNAWWKVRVRALCGMLSVWFAFLMRTRLAHTRPNHDTQFCPHAYMKQCPAYFLARGAWNVIHVSFTCASRLSLLFSLRSSVEFFRVYRQCGPCINKLVTMTSLYIPLNYHLSKTDLTALSINCPNIILSWEILTHITPFGEIVVMPEGA